MPQLRVIDSFQGEHHFLSNFFPAEVYYNGHYYMTAEHAYQAAKTSDPTWRRRIQSAPSPGAAKRLGRRAPMREDWENLKVAAMSYIVADKFARHDDLAHKLAATGEAELIEGNYWGDKFWGVCDGEGENMLGKILMAIRDEVL